MKKLPLYLESIEFTNRVAEETEKLKPSILNLASGIVDPQERYDNLQSIQRLAADKIHDILNLYFIIVDNDSNKEETNFVKYAIRDIIENMIHTCNCSKCTFNEFKEPKRRKQEV